MEKNRAVLSVKNTACTSSGIPKPSRLPLPGNNVPRKRPLHSSQDENSLHQGKENEQEIKRAKLAPKANLKKPAPISQPKFTSVKNSSKVGGNKVTKTAPKKTTVTTGVSRTTTASGSRSAVNGKQKRPAWDIKGKLQDMAAEQKTSAITIGDLQTQLESFAGRLQELEKLKEQQEGTIKVKQEEYSVASTQIKDLEEKVHSTTLELETMKHSKILLESTVTELESALTSSRAEVSSLKAAITQMAANMSAVQCELEATKMTRDNAQRESTDKSILIEELKQEILDHKSTINQCQSKIREDETARRKLHNAIQELKGNIRVFCRVRPFLSTDAGCIIDSTGRKSSVSGGTSRRGSSQRTLSISYPDQCEDKKKLSLEVVQEKGRKNYDFDFDQVFGPESTQEQVFSEISQLVQSALDGYNICIFAYGQTGSGKTFTMEGPEDVPRGSGVAGRGMIPRAVEQVFSSAMDLKEKGWEYKMEASFLEIYNETLRDLLATTTTSSSSTQLDIKMDPNHRGEVYVTNVTPCVVTSQEQVQKLLERAGKNRAVAATQCNERSSRSHSVFILKISGQNGETGESCQGVLNLVDLAGSERLTQSGSVGERLKETQNINKSLSNLGNVIMALANKDSHVPYRNSKLTYLLQNSLGGNSKTLMFVNVSPQVESLQESLCSLRFATKVNQCNIGTARKTVK